MILFKMYKGNCDTTVNHYLSIKEEVLIAFSVMFLIIVITILIVFICFEVSKLVDKLKE